ncbi:MAG: TlpA family protein disulfide reductase [Telluria sp.]
MNKLVCAFLLAAAAGAQAADPDLPNVAGPKPAGPNPLESMPWWGAMRLSEANRIVCQDISRKEISCADFAAAKPESVGFDKHMVEGKLVATAYMSKPVHVSVEVNMRPGALPPEWIATTLAGKKLDFAALKGQPTLISFYFADCAPCINEIPQLNAIAARYPQLRTIAVTPDTPDVARQFAKERALAWDIAPSAGKFMKRVGVKAFPTLLLLDSQGKLVSSHIGGDDGKGLDGWINAEVKKL